MKKDFMQESTFSLNQLKDLEKPYTVLEDCKILAVKDNTIELERGEEKGRFLYNVQTEKWIDYFEIKNANKHLHDPIEFPYFNLTSNQEFLEFSS